MLRLALVLAIVLGTATSAWAGGFATVGLSSTPDGTAPGSTWDVELTVLQHGRTPLTGVEPKVILRGPEGVVRRFPATATGEPGVYRASVALPTTGRWRYAVDDGFTQVHELGFVRAAAPLVVPPTPAASDDGINWGLAIALGAGAGMLVALLAGLRRRRAAS